MNADVYAALLTAGNNLQPVGSWLAGGGAWVPILTVAAVIVWRIWRVRPRDNYRSRNDQIAAQRIACFEDRPEPGAPGRDLGLYLDCVAIYGDCDELDRLRDAIDQHRTGDSNG